MYHESVEVSVMQALKLTLFYYIYSMVYFFIGDFFFLNNLQSYNYSLNLQQIFEIFLKVLFQLISFITFIIIFLNKELLFLQTKLKA